jgi:hypothetical protein
MWCEGYNTYHLIDGYAMKEAWGGIMPHILLSPRNLEAILDVVKQALAEDSMESVILTPRMRAVRLRGGSERMEGGFNTDEVVDEYSVVSIR